MSYLTALPRAQAQSVFLPRLVPLWRLKGKLDAVSMTDEPGAKASDPKDPPAGANGKPKPGAKAKTKPASAEGGAKTGSKPAKREKSKA